MPFPLFRMVYDDCAIDEIRHTSPCMLGPFATSFLNENDLSSAAGVTVARKRLMLIMQLSHGDTCRIEALHASIRRLLLTMSQTHVGDLQRSSAEWVIRRARNEGTHFHSVSSETDHQAAAEETADDDHTSEPAQKKHRKMNPGRWRAFVSERHTSGSKLTSLSEEYKHLSESEKHRLDEKARLAYEAKLHGKTDALL